MGCNCGKNRNMVRQGGNAAGQTAGRPVQSAPPKAAKSTNSRESKLAMLKRLWEESKRPR